MTWWDGWDGWWDGWPGGMDGMDGGMDDLVGWMGWMVGWMTWWDGWDGWWDGWPGGMDGMVGWMRWMVGWMDGWAVHQQQWLIDNLTDSKLNCFSFGEVRNDTGQLTDIAANDAGKSKLYNSGWSRFIFALNSEVKGQIHTWGERLTLA